MDRRLLAALAAGCLGLTTVSAASADVGGDGDGADVADLELEADLEAHMDAKKSLGRHLTDKLTLWSNELGTHVNMLTLDLVDLQFDMQRRNAHVRVGALSENVGLRVAGNIRVRANVARIRSSLALAIRGQRYRFELPVFEVTSQDVGGERSVEVRVPIVFGRF